MPAKRPGWGKWVVLAVVVVLIIAGVAVLMSHSAEREAGPGPDRTATPGPEPTKAAAPATSSAPATAPTVAVAPANAVTAQVEAAAVVEPQPGAGTASSSTAAVLPIDFTQARPQPNVTDQATFDRMAAAALDALHASPRTVRFELEGHTSGEGTTIFNLWLGQRRAEEVRSLLVARGLPYDRFVIKSKGAASPLTTENTPEAQARNRRVTLRVLGR